LTVGDPASEGETVEFWAHPRRGVRDRDRRITLGWGGSSLRFRTGLAPEEWSHISVSWDEARVRLDLDGQTIESYGLGEPSGVAEPHRLSVGRDALTSAPRWVALYNSSIDVRSVVRHYRAALPLMRPVADPPANRGGRVIAHAAAVPANTVLPAISGTAKDGQTLTSTTGTWTGSPTSYVRQWVRCDTAGANCTNISGATSTTYVLTATDVGQTIRVKITATNASGSANVNSAQTATVVAAAPVVSAVPAISGTAKDGQTLTSTTGTWSGTPTITYARQWNRCNSGGTGCVAISGATGTTYVVTTADIGSKLNVTVTASNAAGSASSSSVVTALVVGAAPVNTALPVVSGTAKEGQLLSVTTGTWTGSPTIAYTYQWQQCTPTCTNISGATASTYRLVAAQVGKTIKAVVTATNGTGSASATSAATATVTTGAPVNTALPVVTGTTTDGQALSSTTGTWAGTATITYARQWKRCDGAGANCTNISGATGTTYTLTSTDVTKTIKLTVTATNGVGSTAADAATTAVIAGVAPANTAAPTITGTAQDGQVLTSATGTWSGSTPITYARQWNRCDSGGMGCVAISGATATTYTVTAADIGSKLKVTVTASNTAGSASSSSVATALVVGAAPANTVLPVISGIAKEGQLLSVTAGTWTGSPTITYGYQWQSCTPTCTNISGATDSTYRLVAARVGKTVKVIVTATNSISSVSATSLTTATITTGAPVNADLPVVTGTATDGQALSSTTGTWAGTATITYARQWKRCDGAGANCTSISGATGASYTLTSADVGATIKLTVTATNGVGNTTADAATTAVIAGRAPANTALPTLTGTATEGQTLTAGNGTWTGTPPITYSYQWKRCDSAGANCTTISGATASTYTLVSADVGNRVRARVTATNSAAAVAADSYAVFVGIAPTNTAIPTVTGTVQVGRALTATDGSWSGTPTPAYDYQWQRCNALGSSCVAISGATASTYTQAAEDLGLTLRVQVTATNVTGQASATSAATTVVSAATLLNTTAPVVTGDARSGHELSASAGEWSSTTPVSTNYQWQECETLPASCADLTGADEDTLDLDDDHVGHRYRVVVTASNGLLTDSEPSALTSVITVASADEPTITLSGTLVANPTNWLTASSYQLTVLAGAGTDSEGLQSVIAKLDDEQSGRWDEGCSSPACTVSHTLTVSTGELTEGEHDLDVVAYDTDGSTTQESVTLLIDHGLPQAPSDVVVMDDLATNVVSWTPSPSADAAEYEVLRRTSPTGTLTSLGTTIEDTFTDVLPPAGTIEYVVRTHDSAGNLSTDSNAAAITFGSTAATAPTGLHVDVNQDGALQLDWNTTATATGYVVYEQALGETDFSPVANVAAPATTFIEDSADAAGQYDFQLRAIMAGGRLTAPTTTVSYDLLAGEDSAPDIELSGEIAEAGDSYLSGTMALDIDATEGTTEVPAPGVEKIDVYVDDALAQTWSASCATNSCAMQRTWNLNTTILDDGSHEVRVVATDANGHPAEAGLSIRVDNAAPGAPAHAWITKTGATTTVHWSPSTASDLAGYVVLADDDGVWDQSGPDATSVDFPFPEACDGSCTWKVAAVDDAGRRSTTVQAHFDDTTIPAAPVLSGSAAPGTVSLNWTTISGAGYLVFRSSPGNGSYEQITPTPLTGTTYADSDIDPGVTYYYVVRAVTTGGAASGPSNEISTTPGHSSSAPTITLGGTLADHQGQTLSPGSYHLTAHAAETGAAIELLEVTIDGITVSRQDVACPANNCTLDATADFATADYDDGDHLIQVTATDRNRETTTTAITVTVDAAAPSAIEGLAAVALASDSVRLSWTQPHETDIPTYKIYRGTDPGSLSLLTTATAPATTFDDTAVPTGQRLWYAVQAVDEDAKTSDISAPVSVLPGGAASVQVTGLSGTAFPYRNALNWSPVSATDLAGYHVYRQADGEQTAKLLTPNPIHDPAYDDTTLHTGSPADYTIRTVDTNGHEGPVSASQPLTSRGLTIQAGTSPLVLQTYTPIDDNHFSNDQWIGTDRLGTATYQPTPCVNPPGVDLCTDGHSLGRISPDGNFALVSSGVDTAVRDLRNGEQHVLCTGDEDWAADHGCNRELSTPVFTPDGQNIRWVSSDVFAGVRLWQMPTTGGAPQLISTIRPAEYPPPEPWRMDMAADGSMLVTFWKWYDEGARPETCFAYTLTPEGAVQTTFDVPLMHCWQIGLSSDGDRILDYEESAGYPREISTDLSGGDRRYETPEGIAAIGCCQQSPDGQRLLFFGQPVDTDASGHATQPIPRSGMGWYPNGWLSGDYPDVNFDVQLYTVDRGDGSVRNQAASATPFAGDRGDSFGAAVYPQASAALRLTSSTPSTTYARARDTLTVPASATGINATVNQMAMLIANHREVPTGTPSNASFRVALNDIPEGHHTTHIAAATSSGIERSISRTVVIDNTAPKVTDQLDGTEGDTEESTVVSWDPAKDPALADGTAGSGVQRTQYRYKTASGAWTGWATATDSKFTAPTDDLTETVDLRTEDAAGNQRQIRARMSQLNPREVPTGRCSLSTRVSSTGVTAAYYPQFKIADTRPRLVGEARCHSDVTQLLVTNMCVSVMLHGDTWTKSQSCFSRKRAVTGHTDSFGPVAWTCQRPADGATYFRMDGKIQVFTNILNRVKNLTSSKVKYLCPTESSRVDAEAIGWRALRLQGTSKPSETLGDALGRAYPFEKKRGWQAHHVIPANEKSAEASFVQSIGFRCHIDVNSRNNGIWLRGRFGGLANDTAGYDALASITSPPNLQGRVQHWNYGSRYSAAIAPTLMTALDGDGNCRGKSALAKRLYGQAAIRKINAETLTAGYIPGIGASPPH
jgi:fibronectin type 3 domain-containing protein